MIKNEFVISKNIPREIGVLRNKLNKGLKGYLFFGYFFSIGSLFLLIISFFTKSLIFSLIPLLIVFVLGFIMLKKARETIKKRKICFEKGQLIQGFVVGKGRKFNPFSSSQFYTLKIQYEQNIINITCDSKKTWDFYSIKSKVIGLKWNQDCIFEPEFGCQFLTI